MKNYAPQNRRRGQLYETWELLDFMGPVELWINHESQEWQISFYLNQTPPLMKNIKNWPRLTVRRSTQPEAQNLFITACEVASHLPYRHNLNAYFHPYE